MEIREPLIFFDILKTPLTTLQWYRKCEDADFFELQKQHKLTNGLHGFTESYAQKKIHQERFKHVAWKRVQSFMFWVHINPFIDAVAVSNSISFDNVTSESDIDLFIIAKPKKVWLARFFLTLPAKLLKIRPGETDIAPICLSFYTDSEHLNLQSIAIKNDIYLAHWLDSIIWIYDKKNIATTCRQENRFLAHTLERSLNLNTSLMPNTRLRSVIRFIVSVITSIIPEKCARFIQQKTLPASITSIQKEPHGIILNNHMLKMHLKDKRKEIAEIYEKKCTTVD